MCFQKQKKSPIIPALPRFIPQIFDALIKTKNHCPTMLTAKRLSTGSARGGPQGGTYVTSASTMQIRKSTLGLKPIVKQVLKFL